MSRTRFMENEWLFQFVIVDIIVFGSLTEPFNNIGRSGGGVAGCLLLLSRLEQKARVSAD